MGAARQGHIGNPHLRHSGKVLIAAGTALGRTVESGQFFVLSRNAFEPEAAGGTQDAGIAVTIGILGPDAKVRMEKS